MTIGEILEELNGYDPEMEVKAETPNGEVLAISHVWQWDNTGEEPILNTHITIQLDSNPFANDNN